VAVPLLRVLGTFGLAVTFLVISPALRETLLDGANYLSRVLTQNSPGSYVAVGMLLLAGAMFGVYRASQPR
jgi:hypothetical protein